MSLPKSESDVLSALSSARLVVQLAQEKGVVRHNLAYREPLCHIGAILADVKRDFVASRYNYGYASRLCTENPAAVFNGLPLPEQEPPIYDDTEEVSTPWWKKIFGK